MKKLSCSFYVAVIHSYVAWFVPRITKMSAEAQTDAKQYAI